MTTIKFRELKHNETRLRKKRYSEFARDTFGLCTPGLSLRRCDRTALVLIQSIGSALLKCRLGLV